MHQPSQVPHCRASPPVPASAPRMGWAMPSPGSLTDMPPRSPPVREMCFYFVRYLGLILGGSALGNPNAIWGCKGAMAAWRGAAGPGAAQPQTPPPPHPPCGTSRAPPDLWFAFSLVTFHYGTPFNFSYLIFGIFTVDIISTYFLPWFVV